MIWKREGGRLLGDIFRCASRNQIQHCRFIRSGQDSMHISTNTHRTTSRPHNTARFLKAAPRKPTTTWRPEASSLTREELRQIILELLG